jgi:hypothetical protein
MEILDYIRGSLVTAHSMQDIALVELTDEVAHWQPTGTANSIAQLLAHMVGGEDRAVNLCIKGGKTLAEQGWGMKTGVPQERGGFWRKDWTLNIPEFQAYAAAVHASAEELLANMQPDDLDKPVEWFNGPNTAGGLIRMVVINHVLGHCGEVSALKGMQGLKGLPF